MKTSKILLLVSVTFSLAFSGCDSTEPLVGDEATIQAMSEADQLVGTLTASDGYVACEQMPELSLSSAELNIQLLENFSKFFKKSLLNRTANSVNDTNPMMIFMYLYLPKGTYTLNGYQWSHESQPDNEIIIIFPYTDPVTHLSHTGMLRYHNMEWTGTSIAVSADIIVDNEQAVETTLQVTGTGLTDFQQTPQITSISIPGFVVDNNGILYNFSMIITHTQITIIVGLEGETFLNLTMTGDAISDPEGGFETISIVYGGLTIYISDTQAESGEVGYIMLQNVQEATIVIKNGELWVRWNDGTEGRLAEYIPNTSNSGGGGAVW